MVEATDVRDVTNITRFSIAAMTDADQAVPARDDGWN